MALNTFLLPRHSRKVHSTSMISRLSSLCRLLRKQVTEFGFQQPVYKPFIDDGHQLRVLGQWDSYTNALQALKAVSNA